MKLLLSVALCAALMALAAARAKPAHPVLPKNQLHFGVDHCDLSNDTQFEGVKNKWQKHHGINCSHHPNGCKNLRKSACLVKDCRSAYFNGTDTVLCGLTKFSHLTKEEFASIFLGGRVSRHNRTRRTLAQPQPSNTHPSDDEDDDLGSGQPARPTPASNTGAISDNGALDWANEGYVTPVKNQGQCGCCWAFASTGCMEAAYYRAFKTLPSFSEEQLVECVGTESRGCNGGAEPDAYSYVRSNGGIDTEASYPYSTETEENGDYSKCSSTASGRQKVPFSLTYSSVNPTDESLLTTLKAQVVDIGLGVGNPFQNYVGGVITSETYCVKEGTVTSDDLNHAVLLVGYNGPDKYWIIKNSWGTDWGIEGYFYLTWATPNMCGISSDPYTVTIS